MRNEYKIVNAMFINKNNIHFQLKNKFHENNYFLTFILKNKELCFINNQYHTDIK